MKFVNGYSVAPTPLGSGVRYAVVGTIFGLVWIFTGACIGPFVGLICNGVTVMLTSLLCWEPGCTADSSRTIHINCESGGSVTEAHAGLQSSRAC